MSLSVEEKSTDGLVAESYEEKINMDGETSTKPSEVDHSTTKDEFESSQKRLAYPEEATSSSLKDDIKLEEGSISSKKRKGEELLFDSKKSKDKGKTDIRKVD